MTWNNLLAWSLQIALLVAVAEVAARLLRWRVPAARLLYWQAALLACLALPLVGPWKHTSATASGSVSAVTIMQPAGLPAHHGIPLREVIAVLLAAGILVRGIWLTAGFRRLRQYRRQARWLASREGASLCLCEAVSSPVTFGFLRPVVLLPSHFSDLELEVQEAILCHELLHVRPATGCSPWEKNSCARSSGSIPRSGGYWRKSVWHANRKWTGRWSHPPRRATNTSTPCSPSPDEGFSPTWRRHRRFFVSVT